MQEPITRATLSAQGWNLDTKPDTDGEYEVFRLLGSDPDGELFGTVYAANWQNGDWIPEVYAEPVIAWRVRPALDGAL